MQSSMGVGHIQSDDLKAVVDYVKSRINAYNIQVNPTMLIFYYFKSDNPDMEQKFEEIRQELVPKGYIPFLQQREENVLVITHAPERRYRSNRVNLILFFLTLASTIFVGSEFSADFVRPGPLYDYRIVFDGFIFFSAPLLLILGLHELGHYVVAKRYKVRASFPFFIPVPFSIGTFGAFISIRDPIPNRRIMTEIGAAGPLVGFATAFPLLFVANYLQGAIHPISDSIPFLVNFPLIYKVLGITVPHSKPLFPMVFAVWVGIFATAMNLLPISQLDGGHVARGLLGRRATVLGYAFTGFVLVISFVYPEWLILVFLALLMGLTHPPPLNDYEGVKGRDIVIGVVAMALFILCFTIVPIRTV